MTEAADRIEALRILPPFAIGRLGSAEEPLDNYAIEVGDDAVLGYRRIVPARDAGRRSPRAARSPGAMSRRRSPSAAATASARSRRSSRSMR